MSKWSLHVEEWKDCTRCHLSETRKKIVLAKGEVPAEILFVGEAPGESEDVIGRPFVGPAGHLLDKIIEMSVGEINLHRTADGKELLGVAYTNVVACIPRLGDGGKATEPDVESIISCLPRLEEFIEIVSPNLLVAVGELASKWLAKIPHREIPKVDIYHPAYILRSPLPSRGLMVQKAVAAITTAIEEWE